MAPLKINIQPVRACEKRRHYTIGEAERYRYSLASRGTPPSSLVSTANGLSLSAMQCLPRRTHQLRLIRGSARLMGYTFHLFEGSGQASCPPLSWCHGRCGSKPK